VDAERITVLHVAIAAPFASSGEHAAAMLLMRLVGEVVRCARRIGGARSVTLLYCQRHIVLRLPTATAADVRRVAVPALAASAASGALRPQLGGRARRRTER